MRVCVCQLASGVSLLCVRDGVTVAAATSASRVLGALYIGDSPTTMCSHWARTSSFGDCTECSTFSTL